MDRVEEYQKRVIASCESDIGPLEDGFQYFWVKDRGAMSAPALRIIADELDRRNKDWEKQIERELSPPHVCDAGQLPDDFVTYFLHQNRTVRYSRIETGNWDEWIWNGEWIFSDNVGDSTALDQFLNAEHVAVLIR